MKRKDFNAPIRAIWGLVLGLILCIYPDNVGNYLVILLGLIFMVPSAVSIILYIAQFMKTNKFKSRTFPVIEIGCLIFGAWLVISPANFVQMLTVIIGLLMIIGSVQQLYGLQLAKQWTTISGIHYFVPIILLVSGIIVILNPIGVVGTVMTFAGIVILIYSFNELIRFFMFDVHKPSDDKQPNNMASPDASGDDEHEDSLHDNMDDENDDVEDVPFIETKKDN